MKNSMLMCVMFIFALPAWGQNTTPYTEYLNSAEEICKPEEASYITTTHQNKVGNKQGNALCYYVINGKKTDQLYFQGQFKNGVKDGEFIYFHNNGAKSKQGTYKDGIPTGTWFEWYPDKKDKAKYYYEYEPTFLYFSYIQKEYRDPLRMVSFRDSLGVPTVVEGNGTCYNQYQNFIEWGAISNGEKNGIWKGKTLDNKPWYEEVWNNGKLDNGTSYDKEGKEYKYTAFQQIATHKEGEIGLRKEIRQNFKYPKSAIRFGIESKVNVRFMVTQEGVITDVVAMPKTEDDLQAEARKYTQSHYKFKRSKQTQTGIDLFKSIYPELEASAVDVIKKLKNWNSGKVRGQNVNIYFIIPIVFSIKQ